MLTEEERRLASYEAVFFVANSLTHHNRLVGEYRNCGVKKILLNFMELARKREFSFDPSIEYIIDSGAHTLQQADKTLSMEDMERFVEAYAIFIKKTCHLPCITFYAEVDTDGIHGEEKVSDWREQLSAISPKVSPVWHLSREKDLRTFSVWKEYCERYDWVAIGGKWKLGMTNDARFAIVKHAYEVGTKVHAMANTGIMDNLEIPFYSSDSSSWLEGEEHGLIPEFDLVKLKVNRRPFRETMLAGTNYIERTRYVINQYIKLEKGLNDLWESRGCNWDEQIERMK